MGKNLEIGRLSGLLGRPLVLAFIFIQFAAAVYLASAYHSRGTSDGCLFCHADMRRMAQDGYPQFYVTAAQAERESRMPGATCVDCHLGDGRAKEKDAAHRGMLKLLVLDRDLNIIPRKGVMDSLIPSGGNRMYALFPKTEAGAPSPDIFTVLWHDRDTESLGYDPEIARKTCGRPACHPQETAQFDKTDMGGNVRQRSTRHWLDSHGPNNCGPSFADLPPDTGAKAGLSEANYKIIKDDLSCPSSYRNATDRQRYCNICHAGCLDCHYNPSAKEGVHAFARRIPSETCTGGGRGTGMCHSGSQERRRGDSYLGAEFSQPEGMETDPHYRKKMECMDCHQTGELGMGDMQRQADCSGCHYWVVKAHQAGAHRKLRCQACHVTRLGGYEMTVWGEGHVSGRESPFKKYSLYYGVMEPPILIKDQEGYYTPYKIWPNMATNIKDPAPKREGIEFRWPKGETRDAYAFLGTYDTVPGVGNTLAWLQLEAVGHPLGKSRTCKSCHALSTQHAKATWEYMGQAGSDNFTGEQEVVAGRGGLSVKNIRLTSKPALLGDARLQDFAAWLYMGDIWNTKGDFSIPVSDQAKYVAYEKAEKGFKDAISGVEKDKVLKISGLKRIKEIGDHDPVAGLRELMKTVP